MFALPTFRCLDVEGPDAQTFLHAQVTTHVAKMQVDAAHPTGLCDRKGRLVATGLLWRRDETAFALVLPSDMIETVEQRLLPYRLRAKVTFSVCDTVSGASFEEGDTTHYSGLDTQRLRLPGGRLLSRSESEANPSAVATWFDRDILAQFPWIFPATSGAFLPQHVSFDRIGGVDFDKGCYLGQEVVARLHFKGESKRHWVACRGEVSAKPGDTVCLRDSETVVGTVLYTGEHLLGLSLQDAHREGDWGIGDAFRGESIEIITN